MRKFRILIALSIFMFCKSAICGDMTQVDSRTFKGCEGEGCGCTNDKASNKSFKLYEKMDEKSKLIGSFPKNTKAEVLSPYTILIKAGKTKVTEVSDSSLSSGLKVNDVLSPIFYEGEGSIRGMLDNKWVIFDQGSVKLKTLEAQKSENWIELNVGSKHGYTPTFPFTNCLE